MTNKAAIEALTNIKQYCAANLLYELDYAIDVIKKLEKDGVTDPLNEDFTKLKNLKN